MTFFYKNLSANILKKLSNFTISIIITILLLQTLLTFHYLLLFNAGS